MSGVTEEEAKTRWCPFARDSETAGNRAQSDAPDRHGQRFPCIGSACMAWRFKMRTERRDRRNGQLIEPGTIILRGQAEEVSVSDGGYCGLVGRPE